jgi:hypothetical protein
MRLPDVVATAAAAETTAVVTTGALISTVAIERILLLFSTVGARSAFPTNARQNK